MRPETADVLIIGGGPAGSSCAWKLRQSGLSVTVLDRAAFPRDKICAGWITPGVLETRRIDPAEYVAGGRVLQPITAFATSRMGNREIVTRYPAPVSYGIRRCEFDAYLLSTSGARVHTGIAAAQIEQKSGYWIVNNAFKAPILIGAGGHFCPVTRLLNPSLREDIVAAQEVEFAMDAVQQRECRVDAAIPELYLCRDFKGYGWCFRKGGYLNVGFGRQDREGLPRHVQSFMNFLSTRGKLPRGVPAAWRGHAYLLYGATSRKLGGSGVLLIGDAAGMAYAQSGEGIRPAVESGVLAADTIVAAGTERREDLTGMYARLLSARFGRRHEHTLPAGVTAPLASLLVRSGWFTRHVLLDRWFLHAHERVLSAA